jgi:hypothetical protein
VGFAYTIRRSDRLAGGRRSGRISNPVLMLLDSTIISPRHPSVNPQCSRTSAAFPAVAIPDDGRNAMP